MSNMVPWTPASEWRYLGELYVAGRPSPFSSPQGTDWRSAVRAAVASARIQAPPANRFFLRMTFFLAPAASQGHHGDIDNLVKPTLDAMDGLLGWRDWRGLPQAADHRVEGVYAEKSPLQTGKEAGVQIVVFVRDELPAIPIRRSRAARSSTSRGSDLVFGRSSVRWSILRHILARPDTRVHVRELARRVGHDPAAVSRELSRLESAGVLQSMSVGRSKVYCAAASRIAQDLGSLVRSQFDEEVVSEHRPD